MGFWKNLGRVAIGETAYQTFNNYLSNVVRKRNASIVGPSKQITGEFPEVDASRLYEYYHGWDQIKRSIDTMHQKFMGAGINITSEDEDFTKFIEKWAEIVNLQKKLSDFFLSLFITGNAILEIQYHDDGKIGNLEQIPMQTIYRIFRDEFATDIKIVQNIDGVFKELDPKNYVRWTINNPDRQAFGKSEFNTLAQPRKISGTVDPITGQTVNPTRTTTSLLDAQAELQNAEVEIKKLMAKPRVFASFPGMQRDQLDALQQELEDPASSQWIWAFDKEAKMAEAQISPQTKFDDYGDNVDSHIDIGTGFASKVVSKPGGFSYSSSQTPFDVLDQRMLSLQSDAIEMILDDILRPVAETWGFEDFDDYEVQTTFKPSPRRLAIDDLQKLPRDAVSPYETRDILKDIHIPLDDDLYKKWLQEQKEQRFPQIMSPPDASNLSKATPPNVGGVKAGAGLSSPAEHSDRPKPAMETNILTNPKAFESYMSGVVGNAVAEAMAKERITLSPKINTSDLYVPGGLTSDEEEERPEITDADIATRLQNELDYDPSHPKHEDPAEEPTGPSDDPDMTTKDGTPNENPAQVDNRDLTNGAGNKELDQKVMDSVQPLNATGDPNGMLGDPNPEAAIKNELENETPRRDFSQEPTRVQPRTKQKVLQPDTNDLMQSGNVANPHLEQQKGAYRGKNAPNPNDDVDISGPITNEEPQKTQAIPKQVPPSRQKSAKKDAFRKQVKRGNDKQSKTRVGDKRT